MSQLQRARPDGYAIGLSVIGPEILQPAIRRTGYTHADFDHVCGTYAVPMLLLVARDSPLHSAADIVARARGDAGSLPFGSSGRGTLPHLAMEIFLDRAGVKGLHVPYKSSAEMVTGLLGRQIEVFVDTTTVARQYDLRPLAVFAPERIAAWPDVPTMAEAGWPLQAMVWGGLIGPKGMPAPVVARLERACEDALRSDAYRAEAARMDSPPVYRDARAFRQFVQEQSAFYARTIERLGLAERQ